MIKRLLSRQYPFKIFKVVTWISIFCSGSLLSTLTFAQNATTPPPVSGRNPSNIQKIVPADVLARVKLFSAELSLISKALGKSEEDQNIISVTNASPREVYFEVQALFQKANRLAYEVTGSYAPSFKIQSTRIVPAHVWKLIDAALKRVIVIKNRLQIKAQIKEKAEPNNKTPTDVFNAALQASHELNSLLYRKVSPSDVFEQVTLAINYTENLLKQFRVIELIPRAPALVPDKTPADVYKRLLRCIRLLETVAEKSNIEMLRVHVNDSNIYQVTNSDVFDLSKIIVAEVRYFNTRLPTSDPTPTYYPGYKTPAEVFQRAGILLKQLHLLVFVVSKHPGWAHKKGKML